MCIRDSIINDQGTGITINPDGTLTVPADIVPGPYTIEYQICEATNTTNCDPALVTITITSNTIIADDDNGGSFVSEDGGTTTTVFTNDTLNGTPFADTEVIPTITNDQSTGITINTDGTLTVPANIVPGPYTIEYQICEATNTTNCDPAFVALTITSNTIIADDDTGCLLYTSPSPRDRTRSRMPSSA